MSTPEMRVVASELRTPEQVARALQVTAKTVREWLRSGRLPIPYLKLPGGGLRVRQSNLDQYLESAAQRNAEVTQR